MSNDLPVSEIATYEGEPPELALVSDAGVRSGRLRARAVLRSLLRSRTFLVGSAVLVFWVFVAIFWRFLPLHPQTFNPAATLRAPSAAHWFGTDDFGRDVFARTLAGASSVLVVAPAATAIGVFGGTAIGLVTGYYRGVIDDVVMRIVDALLAFPLIVLALLVLTVLGHSPVNVILVIGVVFAPIVARTVRSAVLAERERDYVSAARLRRDSGFYVMAAEILPNITGPIMVEATIRLGYAIFTEATLSFLSLGIQPPSPDWGLTINQGQAYLQIAPWVALFPVAALASLVVAVNLVADGLRQVVEE